MLSKAVIFISLILALVCCRKASQEAKADTDSTSVTTSEVDNITSETYPQVINDSTSVHLLKWKEISMSEYGPSYDFEDKTGKTITIRLIETPGFDFQKNDYFTAIYSDESVFPTVKLNSSIANTWYKITIVESNRELSGAGGTFPVITSIETVK